MNRRNFIEMSAIAGAATLLFPSCISQKVSNSEIPPYLKEYKDLYNTNPRKAAIEWFRNARYGIYSKLGKGEWVLNKELIPVSEYAKSKDDFTADKFDADFITDLALEAGIIGFQSETAEIFYRNIEIKEFDKVIPSEAFLKK